VSAPLREAAARPLVSCIVPVHNGEKFLGAALDSIAEQRYRPLEILVVDDGSTDGTAGVVAASGIDVRYVRQENAGGPAARNLGITLAEGAFVAFLDADDLWAPEKLDRQMARFTARRDLDISLAHAQNFWMPEVAVERRNLEGHRRTQPVPGYTAGTLLARRELFSRLGLFNAAMRHGEQTEWFLRAREVGAVVEVLPDVLLHRRLHADNVSRHRAQASRAQYLDLVKGILDRRRLDRPRASDAP
jgi:glycosyltransferase involved in cell wall biosynthesis